MSKSSTIRDAPVGMTSNREAFAFGPAVVAAIGIFVLLLRRNKTYSFVPGLGSKDVFVYFVDNRILGLYAILKPYNGYVQIGCRIIAFLSDWLRLPMRKTL